MRTFTTRKSPGLGPVLQDILACCYATDEHSQDTHVHQDVSALLGGMAAPNDGIPEPKGPRQSICGGLTLRRSHLTSLGPTPGPIEPSPVSEIPRKNGRFVGGKKKKGGKKRKKKKGKRGKVALAAMAAANAVTQKPWPVTSKYLEGSCRLGAQPLMKRIPPPEPPMGSKVAPFPIIAVPSDKLLSATLSARVARAARAGVHIASRGGKNERMRSRSGCTSGNGTPVKEAMPNHDAATPLSRTPLPTTTPVKTRASRRSDTGPTDLQESKPRQRWPKVSSVSSTLRNMMISDSTACVNRGSLRYFVSTLPGGNLLDSMEIGRAIGGAIRGTGMVKIGRSAFRKFLDGSVDEFRGESPYSEGCHGPVTPSIAKQYLSRRIYYYGFKIEGHPELENEYTGPLVA